MILDYDLCESVDLAFFSSIYSSVDGNRVLYWTEVKRNHCFPSCLCNLQ